MSIIRGAYVSDRRQATRSILCGSAQARVWLEFYGWVNLQLWWWPSAEHVLKLCAPQTLGLSNVLVTWLET